MSRRSVFWAIALFAVAWAVVQAWWLRWTCDDAYITFRYAQHFVQGHGLVFNLDPQEAPVEGYTNFAWTMWCALGMALGFQDDHVESWAAFWGTACHGLTVFWLARMAWRHSGGRAVVPIGALGYAAIHHGASLAPAGLETALFVWLGVVLADLVFDLHCRRAALRAGCVGVLLAMTRPDGALWVAVAGLFVLRAVRQQRAPVLLAAYAAPFLLSFLPYLLWRRGYYGDWVPNTFHAKSAADPYPGQGLHYLAEFAKCYLPLLLPAPLLAWFLGRRPDLLATVAPVLGRRPWWLVAGFVLPYLGFVVWVGGDFMFGRFVLPVLPLWLWSFDVAGQRWRPVWLQPALAAVLVAGLLARNEPDWLRRYDNPHGFSDNRAISVAEYAPGMPWTEAMRTAGNFLGGVFEGLPVRLAIAGSHANLAYRAKVPVAVECAAGLTDARIARTPVAQRGTVGHEKGYQQHLRYLSHERRVHFMLDLNYRAGDLTDAWRDVVLPVLPMKLVVYDRALMQELRRRVPTLQATDVEAKLDEYLAALPPPAQATAADRERVARDLRAFDALYFDHNDDPARRQRFAEFLP